MIRSTASTHLSAISTRLLRVPLWDGVNPLAFWQSLQEASCDTMAAKSSIADSFTARGVTLRARLDGYRAERS